MKLFKSMKRKISYYFEYKWMTGHISIGRLTLYGRNAMRWGGHFWTNKWGYICFRLPLRCDGKWWPLYLYCSPDATPQASTFFIGGGKTRRQEWATARLRKLILGHNWKRDDIVSEYDITKSDICRAINNRVDIYMYPYAKYAKDHEYDKEDMKIKMNNDEKAVLADTFGFNKDQLYNRYGRFYDKDDSILYRHGNIYHLITKNGKVCAVKLLEQ